MEQSVLDTMVYWMRERENIRILKESNAPKPWTPDPIFQQYKFCNVHREDDFVTRWFHVNWRAPNHWEHPNFVAAIILGRTINWPPTLAKIGFPYEWNTRGMKEIMDQMMARGEKVYTGAYMITAGPPGVKKNDWVLGNALSYYKKPPEINPESMQESWENLAHGNYPCVGPFIAGQVIADLKFTSHLKDAKDWWDWAPLGPGSARGLNRIFARKLGQAISQDQGVKEMRLVKKELELDLSLQDVQNCLCELDKYCRVKLGQGRPRSSYPGLPF